MSRKPVAPREVEKTSTVTTEVFGFGLEQTPEGYRACRVGNQGTIERIGPKLATGEHRSESKASALARAFEAFKECYAPPTKMRFAR